MLVGRGGYLEKAKGKCRGSAMAMASVAETL